MNKRRTLALLGVTLLIAGCHRPDAANIQLRKDNQQLQAQIDSLNLQLAGAQAQIRALQQQRPTVPSLSSDRLEKLFTVHGLKFGRLTGGDSSNPDKGDDRLKVDIIPIDETGDALKAAGSFTVQAFDLTLGDKALLGTWTFSTEQSRACFLGRALMYSYVLNCPWQTIPTHRDLTIRVSFTDELTGRMFTAEDKVGINPPLNK